MPTRTQQDAVNEWYKTQNAQTDTPPEPPKTYTRAKQLFDGLQWEILEHPLATIREKLEAAKIMAGLTGDEEQ